ncbi:MAG: hypothetical protein KAG89_00200 [Fulvimarina manganoxydans]|uniref:hypothetical protein n=1 Tax=Fulvimarina manganoxydans TaxID=937218 RepID=UPI002352A01E|nr:hypothetical protein [Fulvimarina manganoxydans]MCK5930567.1 hypothetical protein [Fulvimarina manganoxydans]
MRLAMMNRRAVMGLLAGSLLPSVGFARMAKAEPDADPLTLTIRGRGPGILTFRQADLARLPQRQIVTTTPWHREPTTFEGPDLDAVLDSKAGDDLECLLIALNDYVAAVSTKDFRDYDGILAIKENGEFLTVNNKGPVFVVFPFSERPELQIQAAYARCVWQLVEIEVA